MYVCNFMCRMCIDGVARDSAERALAPSAEQVRESAAKHRTGEAGLILVACDTELLGESLKWEEARGGQSFPHLYGDIPMTAVLWTAPLPLDVDAVHIFPKLY